MRDDFSPILKETLAKRVGHRCSNPDCRQSTSGPQEDPNKTINVGVAAHITAASPDGPRFDETLSSQDRKAISNGIWLCQKCAKLIDNDPTRYTVAQVRDWKRSAEDTAIEELEGSKSIEKKLADALARMPSVLPSLVVYFKARTDYNRLKMKNVGNGTAVNIEVGPVPLNHESYPGKSIGFPRIPYLQPDNETNLGFTYESFGTPDEQNRSGLHQDPSVTQYLNNGEYTLRIEFGDTEGRTYRQAIKMAAGVCIPGPVERSGP